MSQTVFRAIPLAAAVAALAAAAPGAAQAPETSHYEVRVEGMACPFCTYGLERKLEELDGAGEVKIDLEGGRAMFDVREGKAVTPEQIARAVGKAGFTLGGIEARLRGQVRSEGGELFIVLGGDEKIRVGGGPGMSDLRRRVADRPRELVVEGEAKKREGHWTFDAKKVRAPRPSGG